ncbi:hypothetical protein [Streptomyces sp. Ru62]|nr:hypothetical protein [Streptomyces sp. Ru62]
MPTLLDLARDRTRLAIGPGASWPSLSIADERRCVIQAALGVRSS